MSGPPTLLGTIAGLLAGIAVASRLEHVDTIGGAAVIVVAAGLGFGVVSTVVDRARGRRRREPPA